MGLLTASFALDCGLAVLTLLLFIFMFFNERYKYWKNRGIPYVKPKLIFGNFKDQVFGKSSGIEIHTKVYKELRDNRFGGFFEYHIPNLMIKDPDLIHRILVKDFTHFYDRGLFPVDTKYDPLTNTVAHLNGQDWRNLRHKLSPTFSSGKLKGMYEQINKCGEDLVKELAKYAESGESLEAKDVVSIFTTDVIASCAFGLQFKLDSPEGETFKNMVKKAFPQTRFATLICLMRSLYTNFSRMIGMRVFPKDVTEYFLKLSKDTVAYRKKTGAKRNDFLQLLLTIQENEEKNIVTAHEEEETEEDAVINQVQNSSLYNSTVNEAKVMTDDCVAASSFLFLATGSEVSSSMSLLLYCLATHPKVQHRLQQEIDEVMAKHGGYSYQALKDMTYLDQVIQESLRIYPNAWFFTRECTVPYHIPDSDCVIEKGTRITIPVWAIHRDPKYYPDPDRFDPDRFIGNNYKPSPTYMPFGDGPRICIAMRFALQEMKICTARIMGAYSISVNKKTQEPLQMDMYSFLLRVQGGVWINAKKRK